MYKKMLCVRRGLHRCAIVATIALCTATSSVAQVSFYTALESPSKLAAEALKRGEELRRRWDLTGADAAFREASALDPASAEALI